MEGEPTVSFLSRLRAVKNKLHVIDLGLVLFLPALLGAVFILPDEFKRSLLFDYGAPTLWTAFAATYVHFEVTHLLGNVGMYVVVVLVLIALSIVSGRKQRLYTVAITAFIVFPFVLSYLNLAVSRPGVTYGFSGVAMAFAGLLPIALAEYLETRFDIGPASAVAPAFFFTSMALIAVLSLRSVFFKNEFVLFGALGIGSAAILAAVLYGVSIYDLRGVSRKNLRRFIRTPGHAELGIAALLLLFALPFVGFPATTTVEAGTLNVYTHLLGYAIGFTATYATVETASFIDRRSDVAI